MVITCPGCWGQIVSPAPTGVAVTICPRCGTRWVPTAPLPAGPPPDRDAAPPAPDRRPAAVPQ